MDKFTDSYVLVVRCESKYEQNPQLKVILIAPDHSLSQPRSHGNQLSRFNELAKTQFLTET